jgi:hypothetical protein
MKCIILLLSLNLSILMILKATPYAEEPLPFYHPQTGEEVSVEISTLHFELTYALAIAAGFSVWDAMNLQVWDQLVDSEQISLSALQLSLCFGVFPEEPDPESSCPPGTDTSLQAWPLWSAVQGNACVFSRFGPYSPFFHFPDALDLESLRQWAFGETHHLTGYAAYAWGALTILDAPCTLREPQIIDTGLSPGSLQAFAVYLHCLGDFHSHRDCMSALTTLHAPWGTHTLASLTASACNYNPMHPDNLDAHGKEFGTVALNDSQRTLQGVLAIYQSLVQRSQLAEGWFPSLSLEDSVPRLDGAPTLQEVVEDFIFTWPFDNPQAPGAFAQNRRTLALRLARAITDQRFEEHRPLWPQESIEVLIATIPFPASTLP